MVYYNELDRYPAQWLRNLMAAGHLPEGTVDERSIRDVQPNDVRGYATAHFFAGIGGWPYALALAGWPSDRPVWTGSCPCQPFSTAGKRLGTRDKRHLWPAWRRLIAECHPPTIFGEQVASPAARRWLARVRADLARMGYAVGAADLPAACVGAPHIRQRLFWVATADCPLPTADCGRVAHALPSERGRRPAAPSGSRELVYPPVRSVAGRLADRDGRDGSLPVLSRAAWQPDARPERSGGSDGLALPEGAGFQGAGNLRELHPPQAPGQAGQPGHDGSQRPRDDDPWADSAVVWCDERAAGRGWVPRRVGDSLPLADGFPARVGRIRAYGNAIVPQAAAAFIRAFLSVTSVPSV